ncbi:MAG: RDD family protein [Saprospiraceae bacterium]|nr:RDD family protein [Saprospiraceae bacterium]
MENKKLLKKKRLATLIDTTIFAAITTPIFLLDIILFGTYQQIQTYDRASIFLIKNACQIYLGFVILLFLFKDSMKGQSLGKKFLKLAVVDSATNKTNFKKSLSRNIIGILSIGDLILSFITLRRIGDIYNNTKIISVEK